MQWRETEAAIEKTCAHGSCTRAALTLIYISRNTAERGGGSTGLWDALNVRYQQQQPGGGEESTHKREGGERKQGRNLEEC